MTLSENFFFVKDFNSEITVTVLEDFDETRLLHNLIKL